MASLPAQFTDPSLEGQLQSARALGCEQRLESPVLRSGIDALDECVDNLDLVFAGCRREQRAVIANADDNIA